MRQRLLNPGPANTSDSVKYAQIVDDICPREKEFGDLMNSISTDITSIVGDSTNYTTVLFTASGTGVVEAMITSVVSDKDKLLIIANGAYGIRAYEIATAYKLNVELLNFDNNVLDYSQIEQTLRKGKFTHAFVIHSETTNGILNDIQQIGNLCKDNNVVFMIDAMSSFGAHDIDMDRDNVSFLAASSNKLLQGLPGLAFVVCKNEEIQKSKDVPPRNYYFNLYKQWESQYKTWQMQFTPNVTCMYALRQALNEFFDEGIENRLNRYKENWETLVNGLSERGVEMYTPVEHASFIVTSFYDINSESYNFNVMHDFLKERGWTVYPGKISNLKTFRIANIGTLEKKDIEEFLIDFDSYLNTLL